MESRIQRGQPTAGHTHGIFIIHQWDYAEQYKRLVMLLRRVPNFRFHDWSMPPEKGIISPSRRAILQGVRSRMNQACVVIAIGNPSSIESVWMPEEVGIAKSWNRPLLVVRNYKGRFIPENMYAAADHVARWRGKPIAAAIERLCRQ